MTQSFQKTPTWQSKDSDTPFTTNGLLLHMLQLIDLQRNIVNCI